MIHPGRFYSLLWLTHTPHDADHAWLWAFAWARELESFDAVWTLPAAARPAHYRVAAPLETRAHLSSGLARDLLRAMIATFPDAPGFLPASLFS